MSLKTIRWAEVSLKEKSTGTVRVIYCTERDFDGVIISSDLRSRVWPIFISANSFGSAMDNYLPNATSGSITLKSEHESFGHERRFIDLLDRYTIQNQNCRVALAEIDVDTDLEFPITPDYYLDLTMKAWSYSAASGTITLSVSGGGIEPSVISYQLKKRIEFDNGDIVEPPPESVGRSLPVIVGRDVEVACYRVLDAEYAYAVLPEGHFYDQNDYKCLLQDSNGNYVEIESKVNTDLLSKPYESGHTSYILNSGWTKVAYPFTLSSRALVGQIGVHIDHSISGPVTDSPNQINLQLCVADGDILPEGSDTPALSRLAPNTVLVSGWVDAEYTVPATEMILNFQKPIVLEPDVVYWIVWNKEDDRQYSSSWDQEFYFRASSTSDFNGEGDVYGFFGGVWIPMSALPVVFPPDNHLRCYYSVYGIAITDLNVSSGFDGGRVPRGLTFSRPNATTSDGTRSVGGVIPTDLNNLKPVVIRTEGLLDDVSGTVTGSAVSLIEKPEHVARLFSRLRSPTVISTPNIDVSFFPQASVTPANYSYRVAAGAPSGRVTYDKALRDLCRSTQCRIARRGDGFYFFAEGIRQTTKARFEDSECRVISIREFDGARTIINRAEIYYSKSIINSSVAQGASDGRFQNYNFNSFFDDTDSVALYGEREMLIEAMEYIGDQVSGDRVSRLLVDKWSEPAIFVDMAVPLAQAKGVDMLDVIEITSPELQAFFGTSYRAKAPSYGGELVDQGGMYEKRARKWRGIVEARDIAGSQRGATELLLSVRLFSPRDINY